MGETESKAVVEVKTAPLPIPTEKEETYFAATARRYRNVFRVLLVTLVLFAVLFVLFFSKAFTYDSLYYFVRDLSGIVSTVGADCDEISYAYHAGESAYALYQGGIVRVSTAGVEIFRPDGEHALCAEIGLEAPRVALSRRYVIVYDFGGNDFYIYNAYDELYHGTTEAPILGITVADSGEFAVLIPSGRSLSAVLYYDTDFSMVQRFERGSATVDMALSENGEKIAFLGIGAEGGVLDIYEIGNPEPTAAVTLSVGTPDTVIFLSAKNAAVVGSDGAVVLQTDGKTLKNIAFAGKRPVSVKKSESGFAVALCEENTRNEAEILLFDKRGTEQFRAKTTGRFSGMSLFGKNVFVLSDDRIRMFSAKGEASVSVTAPVGTKEIFAVSGTRVAAVRNSMTGFYTLGN